MANLVDTNILVYRFDARDPVKQGIAARLLEAGIREETLVVSQQSILEFVAAVTKPQKNLQGEALMSLSDALLEAETLMVQLPVLYPTRDQLVAAIRGTLAYGLAWFDAQIWACAEVNGLPEILSEDFQHGRHYGAVRTVNPFLSAAGEVHELPALYEAH